MDKTHLKDGGPVGTVHEPDTMFLRVGVGTADDPGTKEPLYELSVGIGDYAPMIKHLESGRVWSCAWRRLIALAEAEGLSEETTATVVWHPEPD